MIVVDNSPDERGAEIARARGATVLHDPGNKGFAGGANAGFQEAERAGAKTVLLLNPDVRLASPVGSLVRLAEEHGIAAGRLTDANGQTQAGFTIRRFPTATALALELLGVNRLWPGNPWNRRYRYLDRDLSHAGTVEQPAGAFWAVRTDVWRRLGGFDERFYPVWFEDVDFAKRASEVGYKIQYYPDVNAQHLGGHSIGTLTASHRQVYWYDSLIQYAAKHFGPLRYRAVIVAALLSLVPRTVLGIIGERSLQPITTCFRVLYSLGRRLVSDARPTQRLGRDTTT